MNYDGDLEAEAAIVRIALCLKYQRLYSDLETACKNVGLYPFEVEALRLWRQHGKGLPLTEIEKLYYYFKYEEEERYNKAIYLYNKNR